MTELEETAESARKIREKILSDPKGRAAYDKKMAEIESHQGINRTAYLTELRANWYNAVSDANIARDLKAEAILIGSPQRIQKAEAASMEADELEDSAFVAYRRAQRGN